MLSVRLPPEIDQRLDALAKATGRSKTSYVREAIIEQIGDLEDLYLADRAMERLRNGKETTQTLAEVEAELGLAD